MPYHYREFSEQLHLAISNAFGSSAVVQNDRPIEIGSGLKRIIDIVVIKGTDIYLIETKSLPYRRTPNLRIIIDSLHRLFSYSTLYKSRNSDFNVHPLLALNFFAYEEVENSETNRTNLRSGDALYASLGRIKEELNAIASLYGIDDVDRILIRDKDIADTKRLREIILESPTIIRDLLIEPRVQQKKQEVFVSYRRTDSSWAAGRIADYLKSIFLPDEIFLDTRNIGLGDDFVEAIRNQIDASNLMLVVIGPTWLTLSHSVSGKRRIDDELDYVRLEVSMALQSSLIVIPVLLDDTSMPSENHLPDDLKSLSRRNAARITADNFHYDIGRLVDKLVDLGVKRQSS